MDVSRAVAIFATALFVSGCLSGAAPSNETPSTSLQPSDSSTVHTIQTTSTVQTVQNRTASNTTTTDRYLTEVAPGNHLILRSRDNVTVTVVGYRSESKDEVTGNETYDVSADELVHVEGMPVPGYFVVSLDDQVIWRSGIRSEDQYILTISADGSVEEEHGVY